MAPSRRPSSRRTASGWARSATRCARAARSEEAKADAEVTSDALRRQKEDDFNEIIVSREAMERAGPAAAVEAFLYCGDDGTTARRAWKAFLAAVPNATAESTPLLRVHALPGRWSVFAVSWFEDVS